MQLNKNQTLRDRILEPFFSENYGGGIRRFEGLTYDALHQLFNDGFVDPSETQNDSPEAQEFLSFLKGHKENFTAHGYVVSVDREDYRLSIEGVRGEAPSKQDIIDFISLFKSADELDVANDYVYAWYD
jgi:hypothetical protein